LDKITTFLLIKINRSFAFSFIFDYTSTTNHEVSNTTLVTRFLIHSVQSQFVQGVLEFYGVFYVNVGRDYTGLISYRLYNEWRERLCISKKEEEL
jgi:hypothetical protein